MISLISHASKKQIADGLLLVTVTTKLDPATEVNWIEHVTTLNEKVEIGSNALKKGDVLNQSLLIW